jgi:hypothetical protein
MQLTERDRCILETIHAYDGVLGLSQIRRLFFTGRSQTEERMKRLYQHRYVDRPDRRQRMRLPEMIYWLDRQGAELVSNLNGIAVSELRWRKQPRWSQVEHDLAVVDFRLDLVEACRVSAAVTLETWVPESEFWAYPDRISYTYRGRQMRRKVRPDGFFALRAGQHQIRYLLEIDRGTEDNPRFLQEKVLPGLAYLKSDAYKARFGRPPGRWLVVTTGDRRLNNMLSQSRRAGARGLFYFTTYDQVAVKTMLLSPIWRRADRQEPVPLLFLNQLRAA